MTVSRTLLKRGATDIERKVKAYFASGAAGLVVLQIVNEVAKAYKIDLPPALLEAIPWGVGLLGGYITHSVGVTTHTITTDAAGNRTESTATGAIALPVAGASFPHPEPAPVPAPKPEPDPAPHEVPDQAPTFTSVVAEPEQPASDFVDYDQAATQVLEPGARAQAWAQRYLPQNGN